MKHFFILLSVLTFSLNLYASTSGDSIEIKGVYRLSKGFVLDAYFDRLLGAPSVFDLNTIRSRGLNIYYYYNISLGGDKFSFNPGIGFGFDNYGFSNKNLVFGGDDSLFYAKDPNSHRDYKKSKINATYLDIPMELQFKSSTNLNRAFRIAVGIKGGILLGSKSKSKYEEKDISFKEKRSMEHFMHPFRYGLTGRIGIGRFNLFGYYGLSNVFKKHKGPADIQSLMIGITLSTL